MPPLIFSAVYGGNASEGDAAAPPGNDCVIVIGGKGPDVYEIDDIYLQYGVTGGIDWEPNIRSFTGRLTIAEGIVKQSFANGVPNLQLSERFPDTVGKIVFDELIHYWTKPIRYSFAPGTIFGSLRTKAGSGLSVIASSPVSYTNPGGVARSIHQTMLHVTARKISDDATIHLGPFRTKD